MILASIGAIWGTAAAAQGDAVQQFQALRRATREAHQAGDTAAYLASSQQLYDFLHGSAQARLQLVAAKLYAGDVAAALAGLHEYAAMGGGDGEALKDKRFDTLRSAAGFAADAVAMNQNAAPQSQAVRQLTLAPAEFVPEDLDYDAPSDTFYITSVLKRRIVGLQGKALRVFARAPDPWPLMAIKVDARHRRVWATEIAAGEGKSAVLEYDLRGRLLKRLTGPDGSQLGDMALMGDGVVVVSDGEGGGIYRILPGSDRLTRLDHGDFVSPQTPCPLPDGRILIPDYVRGIGKLDPASGAVEWLHAPTHQLDGIDGLYLYGRSLIATQNGAVPERVVRFEMDEGLSTVESETIIERATPSLGEPTHGVVVGREFYYLANSGWQGLDEHARKKPGAEITAPVLMRATLAP